MCSVLSWSWSRRRRETGSCARSIWLRARSVSGCAPRDVRTPERNASDAAHRLRSPLGHGRQSFPRLIKTTWYEQPPSSGSAGRAWIRTIGALGRGPARCGAASDQTHDELIINHHRKHVMARRPVAPNDGSSLSKAPSRVAVARPPEFKCPRAPSRHASIRDGSMICFVGCGAPSNRTSEPRPTTTLPKRAIHGS